MHAVLETLKQFDVFDTTSPAFEPGRYLTKVGGADSLEVKWRLVWLRETHPDAAIETELICHVGQDAIFRARVTDPAGDPAIGCDPHQDRPDAQAARPVPTPPRPRRRYAQIRMEGGAALSVRRGQGRGLTYAPKLSIRVEKGLVCALVGHGQRPVMSDHPAVVAFFESFDEALRRVKSRQLREQGVKPEG